MFTEVLGQLVLDDFKQTDITVKLVLVMDVLDSVREYTSGNHT
jgi:hypothetical protein